MTQFTRDEARALMGNGWLVASLQRAQRRYARDIIAAISADGSYLVTHGDEIVAVGREDNCILAALEANDQACKRRERLRRPGEAHA